MGDIREEFAQRYCLTAQLLELSETLIQAAEYLVELESAGDYRNIFLVLQDMGKGLFGIQNSLQELKMRQESNELVFTIGGTLDVVHMNDIHSQLEYVRITLASAKDSLNRIIRLCRAENPKAQEKLKYEMIPFCIVLYERIHDLQNMFAGQAGREKTEKRSLVNKYREDGRVTGRYKYKLSVCVTAYNKLKYTKSCVDCLVKYLPQDISHELILVNHGSNDGTKEYFESVSPTKQVDVLMNGSGFTSDLITEGEYILGVTNDVLITPHAVKNMIACIESNPDYGFVVPTTPNISNLQSIEARYRNLEEMFVFAEKNNKSDPYRWEERFRLCNPISLQRADYSREDPKLKALYKKSKGCKIFPDDSWSFYMRRNGYKNILAKDAYCYHFGSITIGEQIKKNKDKENDFYSSGRLAFKTDLGIDPWGLGFCFDQELCGKLDYHKSQHVDILAINCGYGSTPLKIKESIKETAHNLDVTIFAYTDNREAAADASILSDHFKMVNTLPQMLKHIQNQQFDYIVIESDFITRRTEFKSVQPLFGKLRQGGVLAVKNLFGQSLRQFEKNCSRVFSTQNWSVAVKE